MTDLRSAVVVLTGASSGIGRAAALAFARRGARLVLAARRRDALEDVAEACRRLGGEAVVVPTDVTDPEAVQALAQAAERAFGGIDVWINNAGTGVFGPYQNAPLDLHRLTVAVNLLGGMYGAYAALPTFLRQGHGTLITNISLGGWAPAPFAAAYTASKFGLRGFTAALRQELRRHRRIHVCSVFPAMIDTPGLDHGANVSGKRIDAGPLVYAPEDVAETFVHVARHPHDEVAVGWPARAAQAAYALAPGPTEHLMGIAIHRALDRAGPAPVTHGALRAPLDDARHVSGGWRDRHGVPSARRLSAGLGLALGAGALLLAATAAARSR
ncbi:short-chain dehydrogenase [Methylobacterium variabile]|uniref:Short-chain dehydrogenase n=1 Tax=Methylobacterium variabile TaxID=298794 RepID=A0A0J6SFC6_9HYPH|nr:SDR family oxidoreductase [Methylobacterium variabile]KMO32407.1 short-chain dehydrogenase [Methylobacterium variabile]